MDVPTIKRKTEIYIEPSLLILNGVEERLDKPKLNIEITWTDMYGTERNIKKLTDGHAANLAPWLRDRGFVRAEAIVQGELERRCTGKYPKDFDNSVQEYKSHPETWRMKVK